MYPDTLSHLFVLLIALVNSVNATLIYLPPGIWRRYAKGDMKTVNDPMSTEAIIGVIGVVVAILGIASSLAWSKARRRSRGRSHRALSLSNAEGAGLPFSNRPSHTYPFDSSQQIRAWMRTAGGDDGLPQHQRYYYVQYERIMVHGAIQ